MKDPSHSRLDRIARSPFSVLLLIAPLLVEVWRGRLLFVPYPVPEEFLSQWYPYLRFLAAEYGAGHFPLWCHNLQAGFPLAAFPHAGAFYPSVLLFALLRFAIAFPLLVFLHLAVRVYLMYGLLREWPRERFSAWLGAAIYGLCGCSLHMTGHLEMFTTLAWVPGILWFGLRLARRGKRQDFFLLAGASSLGYLAGDLEIVVYTWLLLLGLLALVEKTAAKRVGLVFLAGCLSLAVCAGPFLLSANYLFHSARHGAGFNPGNQWKFLLSLMVMPWAASTSFTLTGQAYFMYVSYLLPAGALAALRVPGERRLVRFLILATAAAALFYGNLRPLNIVFDHLPILRYTSVDMRFRAFFPILALALILAARGFERVGQGLSRSGGILLLVFTILFVGLQGVLAGLDLHSRHAALAVPLSRFFFLFCLISVGAVLFRRRTPRRTTGVPAWLVVILVADLVTLAYLGVPRPPAAVLKPPVNPPAFAGPPAPARAHLASYLYNDPELWKLFRLEEGPGFIFGFVRNGLGRYEDLLDSVYAGNLSWFDTRVIRGPTLPLLDFLGVRNLLVSRLLIYGADPAPLDSPFLKSAAILGDQYLGPLPPRGRRGYILAPGATWTVAADLWPGDRISLELSEPAALHLQVVQGNTVLPGPWPDGLRQSSGRVQLPLPGLRPGSAKLIFSAAAGPAGDFEIIAPALSNEARPFHLVFDERGYQVYENRFALDRYGLYTEVMVADDKAAREIILDPGFDPAARLILPPSAAPPALAGNRPRTRRPGDVAVFAYASDQVRLQTTLPEPAYLSIAESYYPGWRAWVDGQETRLTRADYAFTALPLATPGPHQVTLKFLPVEFRIGLWISLTTALVAALLIAATKLSSLRNPPSTAAVDLL